MTVFHPLTEKMYKELKKDHTKEEVDQVVRKWLLTRVTAFKWLDSDYVKEVLELNN